MHCGLTMFMFMIRVFTFGCVLRISSLNGAVLNVSLMCILLSASSSFLLSLDSVSTLFMLSNVNSSSGVFYTHTYMYWFVLFIQVGLHGTSNKKRLASKLLSKFSINKYSHTGEYIIVDAVGAALPLMLVLHDTIYSWINSWNYFLTLKK